MALLMPNDRSWMGTGPPESWVLSRNKIDDGPRIALRRDMLASGAGAEYWYWTTKVAAGRYSGYNGELPFK